MRWISFTTRICQSLFYTGALSMPMIVTGLTIEALISHGIWLNQKYFLIATQITSSRRLTGRHAAGGGEPLFERLVKRS